MTVPTTLRLRDSGGETRRGALVRVAGVSLDADPAGMLLLTALAALRQ